VPIYIERDASVANSLTPAYNALHVAGLRNIFSSNVIDESVELETPHYGATSFIQDLMVMRHVGTKHALV